MLLVVVMMTMASALKPHHSDSLQRLAKVDTQGNWCYGKCLTKFEKQYLESNKTLLEEGLAALHKPGCVRPRKLIVTAGIYRSGSTLLFNQVRLWMNLAFPGNTSVGYDPNTTQFNIGHYNMLVAKVHILKTYVAARADVLVTSRRSIQETLITRLDLHPKILDILEENETTLNERVRVECKRLMGLQRQVYGVWEAKSKNKKIAYDVLLKQYDQSPSREIQKIAEAIGICKEARENKHLQDFIMEMGKFLLAHPGNDPKITQMHMPSKKSRKEQLRHLVINAVKKDAICQKWARDNAEYRSNDLYLKKAKFDLFDENGYR